jgi:SEC-C motif-containing protein
MIERKCYCCSEKKFEDCCGPIIKGIEKPSTALALMRSRYSAYAIHEVDYLWATTHSTTRNYHCKAEILNWATSNQWLQLEIINAAKNTVEFKACFLDSTLHKQIHHELSAFKLENGIWFYVDGEFFN